MNIFDEKQLAARRDRDERVAAAYQKLPRLEEIGNEIVSLSVRMAKLALGGNAAEESEALSRRMDALAEERRVLLASAGFPEDQLEERYDCLICGDTGFVDGEKCSCFLREESRLLYAQANLDTALREETFDHFSPDYYDPDLLDDEGISARDTALAALEAAKQFVENFGKEYENLYLYGEVGTGKTFLTHCIASALLDRDVRVLYFTSAQLFDILGKATFRRDEEFSCAAGDILSCDLLIIDDLGSELTNSFVTSQLFTCVNERILGKRPTIISTNLSLAECRDLYTERVASRITGYYRIIRLFGNDIRYQKQIQKGDC